MGNKKKTSNKYFDEGLYKKNVSKMSVESLLILIL